MKTDQFYRAYVVQHGMVPGSALENVAAHFLKSTGTDEGMLQQLRIGPYRVDFAWPSLCVVLEVDGPHHFAPSKAAHDAVRDAALRAEGNWLVFHVDGEGGNTGLQAQLINVCQVIGLLRQVRPAT